MSGQVVTRGELRRLLNVATRQRRYWADSHVQAVLAALGEYLDGPDPTVEIAYLKATIEDLRAGQRIPGRDALALFLQEYWARAGRRQEPIVWHELAGAVLALCAGRAEDGASCRA